MLQKILYLYPWRSKTWRRRSGRTSISTGCRPTTATRYSWTASTWTCSLSWTARGRTNGSSVGSAPGAPSRIRPSVAAVPPLPPSPLWRPVSSCDQGGHGRRPVRAAPAGLRLQPLYVNDESCSSHGAPLAATAPGCRPLPWLAASQRALDSGGGQEPPTPTAGAVRCDQLPARLRRLPHRRPGLRHVYNKR